MALQLLWYMLAAFIVGFTLSTLWEWLYFRGRRLQWRDAHVAKLEADLDAARGEVERYRARERGVATAVTYSSLSATPTSSAPASPATLSPSSSEFQSSAARLESEERDLVETARRVVHQETRPLHTFDEPEPEPLADEAPLPFEPEEEGQVGWRFVPPIAYVAPTVELNDAVEMDDAPVVDEVIVVDDAPVVDDVPVVDNVSVVDDVTEVDDDEQIVTTARPLAENISAAEQPNRIITATPQAHAELAELIARLEELERKADARFAADAKSGSVDVVHVDTQDNTNADRANDDHVDGNINDEVGHIEHNVEHNVEHYVEHAVEHTVEHNLDIAEDATATPFPPEKREVRGEAAAQNAATPSNLREISGIGKTYETRLHAGGIHTWQQVAESDVETLQLLTNARAVDVANWITHAAALMRQQQPPSANNPTTA